MKKNDSLQLDVARKRNMSKPRRSTMKVSREIQRSPEAFSRDRREEGMSFFFGGESGGLHWPT